MKIAARERSHLIATVDRFAGCPIAILGDLVADEFIIGDIARVSREAPVLILKQQEKRIVPGGAANAANNLADLGARLVMAGALGADAEGEALRAYFREKGVSMDLVTGQPGYRTPAKSRILGRLGHARPQQVVRVDREPRPLEAGAARGLVRNVAPHLAACRALLLSDYGYGAVRPGEVEWLRRRFALKPITIDSRYDLLKYRRLTASTPNEPEVEQAFRQNIAGDLERLERLARRVLARQQFQAVLVTRGREGMILYEPHVKPREIEIFGSDQVADVTGAGDTVIAVFTLALACGASFLGAGLLANCAAGLVVMKSGTATVTRHELKEALRNL